MKLLRLSGVALLVALVGACGSHGSSGNGSTSFSIRADNGEQPPPCPAAPHPITSAGVLPLVENGATASCVRVGDAIVTQKNLTQATAVRDQIGRWQVDFVLDRPGSDALNRLAAAQLGKQLALEAEGVAHSVPTVHTSQFQGRGTITGLDERTAKRIASELQ